MPLVFIIGYMLLVGWSGVGLVFYRIAPPLGWYLPLMSYLLFTFTGYIVGAVLGANTWAFALKALFSVGLAWWLLIRTIRRGDD